MQSSKRLGRQPFIVGAVWLATSLWATVPALHAQSAENVAVVINDNSPESVRIGEHYARTRALFSASVLRIKASTEDTIERAAYVATIEQPIAAAIRRTGLQDRLLYLVLTKGVPLRIAGTTGLSGTLASVDSELTVLYRRLTGQSVPVGGKIDNPYFLGARAIGDALPFTHREHDIYLVTRIDAYTVEQALALVNRAQAPSTEGRIVLDQRDATVRTGEEWLAGAARRLAEQGQEQRVLLERTSKPARDAGPVLGYSSWGSTDPENRVRTLSMAFVPGSIAANISSFDARTFRQPPDTWLPGNTGDPNGRFEGSAESLIGDLIRDGVTGVSGQVGEPYLLGAVRPEILFPAYLAGFNLAEAFYLATPTLSWHTVIVGDPLCTPFPRKTLARAELEGELDPTTELPGYFAKRRVAGAAAAFRDVPERASVLSVRAEALLARGDSAGARRTIGEALQLAPDVADWQLLLAGLEDQDGSYESAIAGYERVLRTQPNHVIALNNLAYALATQRHSPAEALPLAKRAVALAPDNARVLDTLAWIEHLLGDDAAAAKRLAEAIRLDPSVAATRLHAAVVFAATGVPERAEAELKEALRLDPKLGDEVQQVRKLIAAPGARTQ